MGIMKKRKVRIPFWGKLCAAVLCAVITTTAAGDGLNTVDATSSSANSAISSLESEIARLQQANEQRKNQISSIKGDISGNKEAMQLATDQINGINDEINAVRALITAKIEQIDQRSDEIDATILTIGDKENEIKNKQDEIADLEEENKQNLEKFANLARAMYMKNSSDVIPVLNGSDDWYDYFVYSDVVKNISGQNVLFMQRLQNSIKQKETLIEELNKSIAKLQSDKAALEKEKEEFEQQKAELEQEMEAQEVRFQEQNAYLNSLASKNKQLENQVSALQIKVNQDTALIQKNKDEIDRIVREAQEANTNQTVYNDGFLWPVSGNYRKISSPYGYRSLGDFHYGIDIVGNYVGEIHNKPIYAAQSGTVIVASNICDHDYGKKSYYSDTCNYGSGNYAVIDHGGGVSTLYAHASKIIVTKGQQVKKGDIIGYVGSTGWSTGNHLHFETRVNGVKKNPATYTYQYKYE